MDLDPKIKRLVDDTLEDLFSDKKWIKQVKKKEIKGNTDPLYSEAEARMAYALHAVIIRNGNLI